jgi:UDP-N-acetyl-D-mannosaminuronic acid dehydrogenase
LLVKISVLGLGYIGLPTAAMLATAGHTVWGFDVDVAKRESLRRSEYKGEPEVEAIVAQALASGRLKIAERIEPAEAYLVCVPTPTRDNRPDLSYVEGALADVAALASPGELIILESTVPPGTMDRLATAALRAAKKDPDAFGIAHCPERVIPGAIVQELRHNARVVGGRKPGDAERAKELYLSFVDAPIHVTDCTTAELVKVVENTFRDVNIAFANELALLCEELDIDVWETIRLANNHPRVNILSPGPGVGGHCIPIDPHFLSNANPFVTELIQTARRINQRMPEVVVRRVIQRIASPADGTVVVTLLGASYKPNVDDTRESPAEHIEHSLRERGYVTRIYDPLVRNFSRPLCSTLEEAVVGASALVLVTEHDAFRSIDPKAVAERMRERNLVCARPFFDLAQWRRAGFNIYLLGAKAELTRSMLTTA